MFVGTSAVIVTVTQVTLHGVDTVKTESEQEANCEDVCAAHGCSTDDIILGRGEYPSTSRDNGEGPPESPVVVDCTRPGGPVQGVERTRTGQRERKRKAVVDQGSP